MSGAYYNEIEPYCVEWLRSLIAAGLIPDGEVDSRRIEDVKPHEIRGFTQYHFFAGLGGWPCAARLAGWPDARPLWTGSCPCQPFSLAGKRKGAADPRHLWPYLFPLIRAGRPTVVMGEQVAGKAGYGWFDGVAADMETEDYAIRAVDIPACSVNAPHIRNRLYWVANHNSERCAWLREPDRETDQGWTAVVRSGAPAGRLSNSQRSSRSAEHVSQARERKNSGADNGAVLGPAGEATCRLSDSGRARLPLRQQPRVPDAPQRNFEARPAAFKRRDGSGQNLAGGQFWDDFTLIGPDRNGKFRRLGRGVRLLAHGVPCRVARLRAFGNAIVPEEAAQVIRAYMEVC
jgi:DNA (cytosine-5)-methyltransferase 1